MSCDVLRLQKSTSFILGLLILTHSHLVPQASLGAQKQLDCHPVLPAPFWRKALLRFCQFTALFPLERLCQANKTNSKWVKTLEERTVCGPRIWNRCFSWETAGLKSHSDWCDWYSKSNKQKLLECLAIYLMWAISINCGFLNHFILKHMQTDVWRKKWQISILNHWWILNISPRKLLYCQLLLNSRQSSHAAEFVITKSCICKNFVGIFIDRHTEQGPCLGSKYFVSTISWWKYACCSILLFSYETVCQQYLWNSSRCVIF